MTALFPLFFGPDEAKHYNTVQYLAYPENKDLKMKRNKEKIDNKKIETYNFSEEIEKTAQSVNFDKVRWSTKSSVPFADGWIGQNENEITSAGWSRLNRDYPPSIVRQAQLYHLLGSKIESSFSDKDIFYRFYLIRLFSVFIGTACVLLFYLITKYAGFSRNHGLLITAIAAFQPGFSAASTFVNYDILLIFSFSLFALGAVLMLKKGINFLSIVISVLGITIGILAKGTAIVLIPVLALLILYNIWKKLKNWKAIIAACLLFLIILASSFTIFEKRYGFERIFSAFKGAPPQIIMDSAHKYLTESLTPGRLKLTALAYWGNNRWTNETISDYITNTIWSVEAIAALGLLFFLIYPKKPDFLPDKKVVIFMLIMLAALQLGIRFYDWRIYYVTGNFDLGTPGRYFLPNVMLYIILIFCGIGAILRKSRYFDIALKVCLIAMFAFSLYSILNVIIPRFYL